MKIKFADIIVFIAALLVIGFTSMYAYSGNNGRLSVHIKSAHGEWIIPITERKVIPVKGPIGETKVAVEGGSARVISSPCSEKICVRSGSISKPGQWVACLPNRVFVSIEGKSSKEERVDAVNF